MASTAAILTAKVRAGYRRARDCKGSRCSSVFWKSHDQSVHYEVAELNLCDLAISMEEVDRAGRYDFPCTIYTYEDGSKAYLPELGHGADGIAYTLKKTSAVVNLPLVTCPQPTNESMEKDTDAHSESLDIASTYLKWLRYRYHLSVKCEQGECMLPDLEEGPHYLDALLETAHEPSDHYHDAVITIRDATVSSQQSSDKSMFRFRDDSQGHVPTIAEMQREVGVKELDAHYGRYFTIYADNEGGSEDYWEDAYLVPVPDPESALLELRAWAPECWDIKYVIEADHRIPWFRLRYSSRYDYPKDGDVVDQARRLGYRGRPENLVIEKRSQRPGRDEIWVSIPHLTVYIIGDSEWKTHDPEDSCSCMEAHQAQGKESLGMPVWYPPQRSWFDEVADWMETSNAVGMTGAEQTFWIVAV